MVGMAAYSAGSVDITCTVMELDPATGLSVVKNGGRLLRTEITFVGASIVVAGNCYQLRGKGLGKPWDREPLSLLESDYSMATK